MSRLTRIKHHRRKGLLLGVVDPVVSGSQSTFTANDYDLTANSSDTSTFAPIVRNAGGTPLPDKTVTFSREAVAVSAANSSVAASPGTIANDGVDSCTITVTLRDGSNRVLPDIPASDIVLAVSGTGNTLTQPASATNASGQTTCSFVSTGAATKTVTITARGTLITQTQSVVVTGGSVSRPNEPGGFSVITEWNNESALVAEGWTIDGPTTWGSKTRVTSGYEGTPALGGSAVMLTAQTGGTLGGFDPQRLEYHGLSGHGTELYWMIEAQWAAAGPTNYPLCTAGGGGKQFIIWFTGGGRYILNVDANPWDPPPLDTGPNRWNIYENSTRTYVALPGGSPLYGTFDGHRRFAQMEWYMNRGTGSSDGTIRAYQDNVLIIEATGITFPAGDFDYAVVDHASNGNRPVTGASPEDRVIATAGPGGSNIDTNVWTSYIYLSRP